MYRNCVRIIQLKKYYFIFYVCLPVMCVRRLMYGREGRWTTSASGYLRQGLSCYLSCPEYFKPAALGYSPVCASCLPPVSHRTAGTMDKQPCEENSENIKNEFLFIIFFFLVLSVLTQLFYHTGVKLTHINT